MKDDYSRGPEPATSRDRNANKIVLYTKPILEPLTNPASAYGLCSGGLGAGGAGCAPGAVGEN